MDPDERDRDEVRDGQRATIDEERERARAPEGIEPVTSADANQPTTALADRERPHRQD